VEGATGLCPGSSDYSMPLQRMVNNFLDERHVNLAECFFALNRAGEAFYEIFAAERMNS